ncbi:MAG: DNA cytosine methyltransferase [Clostridia bacterium]|nr:DNA cytosine methyltransferase [Clostridia bacterium]
MRYLSLFSGIEAASVAWEPLGWEPVAFCEVDEFPSAVLAHRWPHVPNLGDITKVDWSDFNERYGAVDVIVGGSPCQSFSVAGKREGLRGESGLMFEYIRAVREVRPRWFVWENVPGALSSEKGAAFGQLLSEMDDLGYGLAWRVLDAQFARVPMWDSDGSLTGWFGPVAQRRRRVFLVGSLGSQRAAEVLFESDSMRWGHPSSREKRQELTRANERRTAEGRCKCLTQYGDEIAGTLTARGDSSPCADRGQNIVCMASGQANAEICYDMAPTQSARQYKDPPIVCIADDNANAAVDFDMCGSLKVGGSVPIVSNEYTARKLTPTECERLQGFPDGHTKIPYRGKSAEECPDTPRYKALGNSFAVPVVAWIGRRIEEVEVGD